MSCGHGSSSWMPGSAMSCVPMEAESKTSEDAILGGRLRIRQPLRGHRVGHDAVLLAAATAARSGELAVDLGAGVGAAGLALAARVPGLKLALVEIDAGLCALASDNARLNRLDDRVVRTCFRRWRCGRAVRGRTFIGRRGSRADESAFS